jgi:fatty-acyl-CoA synthase
MEYFDWSAHQADFRPNKIAIRDTDTGLSLSYAELEKRSCALAGYLQGISVQKGDRVAILSRNSPHFFELEFACGKIGGIGVPLNWRLTVPELEYIVSDCAPKVLMYDAQFTDQAKALQRRCGVEHLLAIDFEQADEYEAAIAKQLDFTPVSLTLDDVAMIMYTSGTTGHPKGAMITHGMNFINCVNLGIPARISPDSVQLVVLPLFHTGGLNCYANPILHAGGTLVLMREFEPGAALQIIGDAELAVTHFFAVPAPYQFMMLHPEFENTDLSRIEVAGVGGAPCAETILQTWCDRGVAMVQGWGMTETSPGGICLDAEEATRKIGSAGKALLHTQIKIVDDEGNTLPHGNVGELLIRGPNITPGYWNNPEVTAKTFTGDWLLTGDAARMDEEGFVYIVDRWKDMYISGGENVYPAEVEDVLYQLPQIAEAAVIGVPSDRWGETGKAVLVLKAGQELDADSVIGHCIANLAKFKVPASVEFIDALPRNATGKVLKRDLRERYVEAGAAAIS